jgi:hypothetical protein
MALRVNNPAALLAALGVVSGALGTHVQGIGFGAAPDPGIYMVLTGVWFGLVMGFAAWRWGTASVFAAAVAFVATWIGWETAVNLAMQIDGPWLRDAAIARGSKTYLAGFAAGAVGALLTWSGVAASAPVLRCGKAVMRVALTGAVFGLLLRAIDYFDSGVVLLVPWQAAVAAMIGLHLSPQCDRGRRRRRESTGVSSGHTVNSRNCTGETSA